VVELRRVWEEESLASWVREGREEGRMRRGLVETTAETNERRRGQVDEGREEKEKRGRTN